MDEHTLARGYPGAGTDLQWEDLYGDEEYDDGSEATEAAVREALDAVDDGPDANYECAVCGCERHVDDYKRETRTWCDEDCDEITFHVRLDSHSNS